MENVEMRQWQCHRRVIATSAFDNRCHVAPTVQAQAVDSEVLLYRRNQSYHRIRPTSYCLLGHE